MQVVFVYRVRAPSYTERPGSPVQGTLTFGEMSIQPKVTLTRANKVDKNMG